MLLRMSSLFLRTLREDPADAEVPSHRLLVRAGYIRRAAPGIYTWLPLGLRVLRKIEDIIREEMDAINCQELLMPVVQSAELWQESGRWEAYGPELLRFKDRHQRDFVLGPTHEEVITDIARSEIKSYRQLPLNFYQIQTKFRDEIRPRFGVMRAREFVMKDAYSFHTSFDSLQQTYAQELEQRLPQLIGQLVIARQAELVQLVIGEARRQVLAVKTHVGRLQGLEHEILQSLLLRFAYARARLDDIFCLTRDHPADGLGEVDHAHGGQDGPEVLALLHLGQEIAERRGVGEADAVQHRQRGSAADIFLKGLQLFGEERGHL